MLLIFTAGVLWGTIGIFVKELNLLGADSALTCFLRMSFAFLIMFIFSFIYFQQAGIKFEHKYKNFEYGFSLRTYSDFVCLYDLL